MSAQAITLVGNLTGPPELRIGKTGTAVCRLTVACQDRYRDAQGAWQDGDTLFQRGVIFGPMAENFAASFNRGDRVVLTGGLRQSEYEHKDETTGEVSKRYSTDFVVDEAAASVRWAEVRVNRASRHAAATPAGESNSDAWAASPGLAAAPAFAEAG